MRYVVTMQETWFMRNKKRLKRTYGYIIINVFFALMCIQPTFIAISQGTQPYTDPNCRARQNNISFYAALGVWAVIFPVLTYLLWSVQEGFYVKKELTAYIAVTAMSGAYHFTETIFGLSEGMLIFRSLWLIPPCWAGMVWMVLYPCSKISQCVNNNKYTAVISPDPSSSTCPLLSNILSNEYQRKCFEDFLKKEFSAENLYFCMQCERTLGGNISPFSRDTVTCLCTEFLLPGAPLEVTLSHDVSEHVQSLHKRLIASDNHEQQHAANIKSSSCALSDTLSADEEAHARRVLQEAHDQIFHLMLTDSFRRFQNSPQYAESLVRSGKASHTGKTPRPQMLVHTVSVS